MERQREAACAALLMVQKEVEETANVCYNLVFSVYVPSEARCDISGQQNMAVYFGTGVPSECFQLSRVTTQLLLTNI